MIPESLRYPPQGRPWLLFGLMGLSLALNLALAVRLAGSDGSSTVPDAPPPQVLPIGEETDVSNAPIPPDQVPPLPTARGVAQVEGTEVFADSVRSSLSATFQQAPTENPAALSAVYSRLFAWDLDLRRDLHKGDIVEVLFEEPSGAEPLVLAARLVQAPDSPQEHEFAAYRYQAPGDAYPSYWAPDGTEVPRRLIDGPLADYEQITSLLKDRPTHEGMDFKTPIGSAVTAPRAAVVTRTNWNHAANGNCVELRYGDGALAKFLHLNENLVKDGEKVSAGTMIARSGNTGHSTGAHLHYQVEKGGRVVDPIDYHGTLRRSLPPEAMAEFSSKVAELSQQLDGRLASR